jgi:hypothetical protein
MAASMLHCMRALQHTPIFVEKLLYPAIQRVILPFGDRMPSTAAGAREELNQVSKPFSLPLHPHTFNSSPIYAGTPNSLQQLFPSLQTCVVYAGGASV